MPSQSCRTTPCHAMPCRANTLLRVRATRWRHQSYLPVRDRTLLLSTTVVLRSTLCAARRRQSHGLLSLCMLWRNSRSLGAGKWDHRVMWRPYRVMWRPYWVMRLQQHCGVMWRSYKAIRRPVETITTCGLERHVKTTESCGDHIASPEDHMESCGDHNYMGTKRSSEDHIIMLILVMLRS